MPSFPQGLCCLQGPLCQVSPLHPSPAWVLPTPHPNGAVVGHKPRPALCLDPCREADLFTPSRRGGCVSGTAPAGPTWRRRRDVGAALKPPPAAPQHPGPVWGESGGAQGKMGPSCLHLLLLVGKGTVSCSVLPTPPVASNAPDPGREITVSCSIPRPGRERLSEQWQSFWESTGRANQPWKPHVPSWKTRSCFCKHMASNTCRISGLMATCWSLSLGLGCA